MKLRKISLFLILFWLILAGLIVWFKVVPNGKITYSRNYPAGINIFGGKGFVGNFTPADRVENKAGQMAKIVGDPVYFSVFTPRTFSEAKVTITYRDNLSTTTPLIEAGVLVDNVVWRYQLAPLENKILDNDFNGWSKMQAGDILLLQKTNRFSSVAEFLGALKDKPQTVCNNNIKSCLALYNTDALADYFSDDYDAGSAHGFKVINIPLQGAHQFYFLSKPGQSLSFNFDFTDLNLDKDSDPVIISVYRGNDKMYSTTIADGFGGESSGQIRNFSSSVSYPSASQTAGLYKLEIKAGDDIVIKKINKAPSALNVASKIHPVNASDLPLSFWTDSPFIKLTTDNPASKQIVTFGGQEFSLSEAYQQFEFSSTQVGIKKISLAKDDVILETDGAFSFAPDDLFYSDFKKITQHFVLTDNIDYVLARYQSPDNLGNGFKKASVVLNTKEAYREKGKYSFMISVPGLSLANSGNLEISNIKVEFSGRTIWDKIKEKFLNYGDQDK